MGLRLFDTWDEAVLSHIDGVMRLLRLAIPDKLGYLKRHHGLSREALLAWSPVDTKEQLALDLLQRSLVDRAGDVSTIRDEDAFSALCERVRNEIGKKTLQQADLLNEVLPLYSSLSRKIHGSLEQRLPDGIR